MNKKTLLQLVLGTFFLLLACAVPGHATVTGCNDSTLAITLDSDSTPGVFTYFLTAETSCETTEDTTITFSGLGGTITSVLAQPSTTLANADPFITSGPGSVSFEFLDPGLLTTGNNGVLEIDCTSCTAGSVNYSIGGDDPSVLGPVAATPTGAPETASALLMLCGLAGLALAALYSRRRAVAAPATSRA